MGRGRVLAGGLVLAALATGAIGGCSDECDTDTVSDVDTDAPFDSYETFAIAEGSSVGVGGAGGAGSVIQVPDDVEVDVATANDAVAAQLEARGLVEVELDEDPDLLVFSATTTESEDAEYWDCVPNYYWWGWYYEWEPCAWLEPIDVTYTVGALVVGVADASTEKPVFGGVAVDVLECGGDIDAKITDAVDTIFKDYPIEPEN